mmetsp:Transcript_29018/g.67264  ORF Transcript_29018/g.67264 Transcript_29018/m.67264 type:complete len:318 (+) Transcript_29018:9481-10434(+)
MAALLCPLDVLMEVELQVRPSISDLLDAGLDRQLLARGVDDLVDLLGELREVEREELSEREGAGVDVEGLARDLHQPVPVAVAEGVVLEVLQQRDGGLEGLQDLVHLAEHAEVFDLLALFGQLLHLHDEAVHALGEALDVELGEEEHPGPLGFSGLELRIHRVHDIKAADVLLDLKQVHVGGQLQVKQHLRLRQRLPELQVLHQRHLRLLQPLQANVQPNFSALDVGRIRASGEELDAQLLHLEEEVGDLALRHLGELLLDGLEGVVEAAALLRQRCPAAADASDRLQLDVVDGDLIHGESAVLLLHVGELDLVVHC